MSLWQHFLVAIITIQPEGNQQVPNMHSVLTLVAIYQPNRTHTHTLPHMYMLLQMHVNSFTLEVSKAERNIPEVAWLLLNHQDLHRVPVNPQTYSTKGRQATRTKKSCCQANLSMLKKKLLREEAAKCAFGRRKYHSVLQMLVRQCFYERHCLYCILDGLKW